MKVTVSVNGQQIAQAKQEDFETSKIIQVEGNYYFDRSLVDFSSLVMKDQGQQYTCPVKLGTLDYYNLVDGEGNVVVDELCWIYEKLDNTLFEQAQSKVAFYSNKADILVED
jgi:uncharacterized protein (DUF427 family)